MVVIPRAKKCRMESSRIRKLLKRNVQRFQGGLVYRLLHHSTLGSRVIQKTKKKFSRERTAATNPVLRK